MAACEPTRAKMLLHCNPPDMLLEFESYEIDRSNLPLQYLPSQPNLNVTFFPAALLLFSQS